MLVFWDIYSDVYMAHEYFQKSMWFVGLYKLYYNGTKNDWNTLVRLSMRSPSDPSYSVFSSYSEKWNGDMLEYIKFNNESIGRGSIEITYSKQTPWATFCFGLLALSVFSIAL